MELDHVFNTTTDSSLDLNYDVTDVVARYRWPAFERFLKTVGGQFLFLLLIAVTLSLFMMYCMALEIREVTKRRFKYTSKAREVYAKDFGIGTVKINGLKLKA